MLFTLVKKFYETSDVVTFVWEPASPISWKAGQFIKYTLPHDNMDDRGASRWFTVAAPLYEELPRFTTRLAGEKGSSFKAALLALNPGATIEASNPMGGFTLEDLDRGAILIAGGIGITPYRAMLLQQDHDEVPIKATLFYANRDENFVFESEFTQLSEKYEGFVIHESIGADLIVVDAILAAGSKYTDPIYYISGPEPMVDAYVEMLKNAGIDEEHIKTDSFPGYE